MTPALPGTTDPPFLIKPANTNGLEHMVRREKDF
jgi:hypothetical protein